MTLPSHDPASTRPGTGSPRAAARRVTAIVFAAQGAAVAGVSTTIPAIKERFDLPSPAITAMIFAVALCAGAGSFLGLAAVRRLGPVASMRACVITVAAALLCIAWAPDPAVLVAAYVLFGLAVGGIDVSANTRAAAVEHHYGHSIFASFYAGWSGAGAVAALVTAGANHLGWPVQHILTLQAAFVLVLALGIRTHRLPRETTGRAAPDPAAAPLGTGIWARLVPLGIVLLVACLVDSGITIWSTTYLHQTLAASLSAAPLAYAAYQAGTVVGRSSADRVVRRIGPAAVVRWAAVITAGALAGLAGAPSWPLAVAAAGLTGLCVSTLIPLCLASAGRLRPKAAEAVLARLNLFNYFGVIAGSALSGILGSAGDFRLAYAAPILPMLLLTTGARYFTQVKPVILPRGEIAPDELSALV
jgi:MFS family permease